MHMEHLSRINRCTINRVYQIQMYIKFARYSCITYFISVLKLLVVKLIVLLTIWPSFLVVVFPITDFVK